MTFELRSVFGDCASEIPLGPSDGAVTFSRATLAVPGAHFSSADLVIQKYEHVDRVRFDTILVAGKSLELRSLACLILSVVFHDAVESVDLRTLHPESTVATLRIRAGDRVGRQTRDYQAVPNQFRYRVGAELMYVGDPEERPLIELTSVDEIQGSDLDEWWRRRDTVVGFGSEKGAVAFAAAILEVSSDLGPAELELWTDGPEGFLRNRSAHVMIRCTDKP